jgi:SSS family solute:Na+ symporter
VLIGLYTRWLDAWALLIGWAAGTFAGTYLAASVNFAAIYPLAIGGWTFPGYIALYTLILNLAIAIGLTPLMNTLGVKPADQTAAADYSA